MLVFGDSQVTSRAIRAKLSAKIDGAKFARPWTSAAQLLGCGVVTPAQRELLELGFLSRCAELRVPIPASSDAASRALVAKDLYIDLSQSAGRRPWRVGSVGTITTSSRVYSYEFDMMLRTEDLMHAYGRDVSRISKEQQAQARVVLGNCMAVQPVAVVLHSLIIGVGRLLPGVWGDTPVVGKLVGHAAC